jgi:HAD superfamily hydrolase (TIGR01509 family)
MNIVERPEAVLWDMDGTLVNTEPYWMAAHAAIVTRYGRPWTHDQAVQFVGRAPVDTARVIQEYTGAPLSVEQIVEEIIGDVLRQVAEHGVTWRPGAQRLLRDVREAGIPCALVTMSYAVLARAVTEGLPPGTFDVVVAGDEVARGKPDPEAYLTAMGRLGADPSRCVAIEDSVSGVAAALGSGARTIAVPYMVPIDPADSLSRISSLTDVDLRDLSRVVGGEILDRCPA